MNLNIRLASATIAGLVLLAPAAIAKEVSPIFGGAKVSVNTPDKNKLVLGKGYYADYYGYYGNYYSNYANYYGTYGLYNTAANYAYSAYQSYSNAAYYQSYGQ